MAAESQEPKLSVVIPLLNEEALVGELITRVGAVLDSIPSGCHEVIFVNDGSTDRTTELIDEAVRTDGRYTAIHLSRNFGHQAAISAGLAHSSGDYVVLMDGDLQDPPEEIPKLLAKAKEGFDVVYARRIQRKESALLRFCYFVAYRFIARMADVELPLDAGDFGIVSQRVARGIQSMEERQRYLRGLRAWQGFRQIGLDIERHERLGGEPKYSVTKLVRLALDGLFAFSVIPLRLAFAVGVVAMAFASVYGAWALVAKFVFAQSPKGFTALLGVIVFLSGVQLVFAGVIGEYVGRIYEEVKRRPIFVVDRINRGTSSHDSRVL